MVSLNGVIALGFTRIFRLSSMTVWTTPRMSVPQTTLSRPRAVSFSVLWLPGHATETDPLNPVKNQFFH